VSAFIICLITLERFLVLGFPLSRLHFTRRTGHAACLCVWVVGVVLAGVPLLPFSDHWRFYQQSGICLPLPVTRQKFPGVDYAFYVNILFK
jgi:hypothetical protein